MMASTKELLRFRAGPNLRVQSDLEDEEGGEYDLWLARQIFTVLMDHFPGHFWQVEVRSKQGIARIRIPILMGDTLGYTLHLSKLANDPSYRAVRMAAGEILERWNIPRTSFSLQDFLSARATQAVRRVNDPIPG